MMQSHGSLYNITMNAISKFFMRLIKVAGILHLRVVHHVHVQALIVREELRQECDVQELQNTGSG